MAIANMNRHSRLILVREAYHPMTLFIENLFTQPLYFFRYVVIIVISIVLHELAHGFAAMSQGDDTPERAGHITMDPVVHMGIPSLIMLVFVGMSWGQMPVNTSNFRHKWSDAFVSAAGPLSNLAIALMACVIIAIAKSRDISLLSTEFFSMMAMINVYLFLFNLLPVPPLDGFTVFSEIFPSFKPLRNSQVGLFVLMVLFMVPVVGTALGLLANLTVQAVVGGLMTLT
jgi:Zn-dependent protease